MAQWTGYPAHTCHAPKHPSDTYKKTWHGLTLCMTTGSNNQQTWSTCFPHQLSKIKMSNTCNYYRQRATRIRALHTYHRNSSGFAQPLGHLFIRMPQRMADCNDKDWQMTCTWSPFSCNRREFSSTLLHSRVTWTIFLTKVLSGRAHGEIAWDRGRNRERFLISVSSLLYHDKGESGDVQMSWRRHQCRNFSP